MTGDSVSSRDAAGIGSDLDRDALLAAAKLLSTHGSTLAWEQTPNDWKHKCESLAREVVTAYFRALTT